MKLGRLPHDPLLVAAVPPHRFGSVPPPPVLDRSHVDYAPKLYGNDKYPDCTAVGYVNAARAVAALNGYELGVEDNAALEFYAACIGNPPDLAATDGAVVVDVLGHQLTHGVDIGPQMLVGRYGRVNTESVSALASGVNRLGAGYWGVTLHDRDMQTIGQRWDVTANDGPVVGGHLLLGWDYTGLGDDDTVRLATWGGWQHATWRWVLSRMNEAYGIAWRQLARTDGLFYNGIGYDGLVAELGD